MHEMFGFTGRMARLPYFGYSVLAYLVMAMLGAAGAVLLVSHNPVGILVAAVLFLAVVVVGVWTAIALWIKRLHDLDLPGTHTIWMILLYLAGNILWSLSVASNNDGTFIVALLISLADLGVALWLLFAPGTPGVNSYGPPPGQMSVGPVAAAPSANKGDLSHA